MINTTTATYVSDQLAEPAQDQATGMERPRMGIVHKVAWGCLVLMIFLIPWGEGVYDGLAKVVAMPTLGLCFVMLILEGTHRDFSLFNLFAVMLGGWYLVGIWWTPTPEYSTEILKTYIMLILMSLMFTYLINNEYKFRGAYQAYVLGSIMATGIIFYNYLNSYLIVLIIKTKS